MVGFGVVFVTRKGQCLRDEAAAAKCGAGVAALRQTAFCGDNEVYQSAAAFAVEPQLQTTPPKKTKKAQTFLLAPFGSRTPANNCYGCYLSILTGLTALTPSDSLLN